MIALPAFRLDVEVVRVSPDSYVVFEPATDVRFELGVEEHFLLRRLDGRRSLEDIRDEYRQRFDRVLTKRELREFVRQVELAGLVGGEAQEACQPAARTIGQSDEPPPPLSNADPKAGLNSRFDLLVLALGWMLHPLCLLPYAALTAIGTAGFVTHAGELFTQLNEFAQQSPVGLMALLLLSRFLVVGLPCELAVGMACRRFHGRVGAFGVRLWHGLLPYFYCDTGDSFALASTLGKWTILTLRLGYHWLLASVSVIGWLMAPRTSDLSTFFLVLAPLAAIGALLKLNIFVESNGYAIVSYVCGIDNLRERAMTETRAWLSWSVSPEPLSDRERFWFRLYGLGSYTWLVCSRAFVVGVLGWWAVTRFDGCGALIFVVLCVWWFSHPERRGGE